MLVLLLSLVAFLLLGISAIEVDNTKDLSISPIHIPCTLFCIQGYKCALVASENCVFCRPTPRCIQRECDTSCVLPCPFLSKCMLVATSCCPKATCRRNPIIFTIRPPKEVIDFTIEPPKLTFKPGKPFEHIP
ncbi:hypothetical protein Y032_0026g1352 [Ancylostoma ceylanicum]|uniref:Uncharacterized protein n=1 Tax=Ancylostoma ceylanicum TaxID=53326 RepID=A0A016UWB4_9BILA|nr:hypothetical protein Y032_0026g1352 [Ancylostoma ceylanicum]